MTASSDDRLSWDFMWKCLLIGISIFYVVTTLYNCITALNICTGHDTVSSRLKICAGTAEWRNWVSNTTEFLTVLPSAMALGIRFPIAYVSYVILSLYRIISTIIQVLTSLPLIDYIVYPIDAIILILGFTIPLLPWVVPAYETRRFIQSINNGSSDIESGNRQSNEHVYKRKYYIVFWFYNFIVLLVFMLEGFNSLLRTMNWIQPTAANHPGFMEILPYFRQYQQLIYNNVQFSYGTVFFIGIRCGLYFDIFFVLISWYGLIYCPTMALIMISEMLFGFLLVISIPLSIYYLIKTVRC